MQHTNRGPAPHGHVTLVQVAQRAGVSAQSVSNALNNPDRVAPETRKRILAAVEELGYEPNLSARALRNRSSSLIAFKMRPSRPDKASLLMDDFLYVLNAAAVEAGYHLILCHAEDGPAGEIKAYRDLLKKTSIDAFVLAETHHNDDRVAALRSWGVPFASFGRSWDGDDSLAWVDVDGRAGTRAATDHVAAQGHRRIGHIGWLAESELGQDRREGWLDACRDRELETDLQAAVVDSLEAGRQAAHRMLDASRPATALVCASDTLALGVMRALHERGLRPGADVAITGYDDSPTAALVSPGLTTLRQPIDEVGRQLIQAIDNLMAGDPREPQHVLLEPELVVRGSSLPGPRTSAVPTS
ncbi:MULTISPECIES: LacI family DNA-binding transcriptional regulator [unclassified Kribbella]|uniref:LacI family DNA-binding transcriptional regulator n=1 Tax=unclassified Kribbella TaxID=2644121 RepID=UPI0033BCA532